MYCRLNQHLSINIILTTDKIGVRKDRSTEQAAYTLILVLISSCPDLLPDVIYLLVRIFLLMLVLLYIYINITNIPTIIIINRTYETQYLLSL